MNPRQQLSEPVENRISLRWFIILLVSAVTTVYWNSFSGVFLFDDRSSHVLGSIHLHPAELLLKALRSTRPVLDLSFILNFFLGGLQVWGYHAVNLAIHLLAALTLFGIVRRTLRGINYGSRSVWLSFWISLIWAVHPLQTQSVTYLVQRGESLMGLFYLLTLYGAIRGADSALDERLWNFAAILSCALGMATKEVMVTAPLMVLIYDRIFLAQSFREAFEKRKGLYLGLCATWMVLALTFLPNLAQIKQSVGFAVEKVNWFDYLKTQPGVILHYLKLTFWPDPLVIDYGWPIARTKGAIFIPSVLVLLLIGLTLIALGRERPIGFAGVWVFLILVPTSSIVPVADLAVEHRMYLPLAGIVTLVVVSGEWLLRRFGSNFMRLVTPLTPTLSPQGRGKGEGVLRGIGIGLGTFAAVVFALVTIARNQDYQSEIGIWRDTVRKRPENYRAYNNLGVALDREGRLDEAVPYYLKALEIHPAYDRAHFNLGIALDRMGRIDDAVEHYKKAVRINPFNMEAHNNLAVAYAERGDLEQAIRHYSEVVRLKPAFAEGHFNLGNAFMKQGRPEEAMGAYGRAIQLKPGLVQAREAFQNAAAQSQARGSLNSGGANSGTAASD